VIHGWKEDRGVQSGVSKGVEDGRRPPVLWAGHPWNSRKTVLGVARLQGVEVLGMAEPSDTLGSPWPPLAIRPLKEDDDVRFSRVDLLFYIKNIVLFLLEVFLDVAFVCFSRLFFKY
jgi:hypothetical protein